MADLIRPLAYLALVVAAWAAAADRSRPERERRVLFAAGIVAILAALAELAGAGGHLAQIGRTVAHDEGWYQGRRRVQAVVILGLAVVSLVASVTAIWLTRSQPWSVRGLVVLVVVLVGFVAIRTVSLHQVDGYLYTRVSGNLTLGTTLEVIIVGLMVLWLLGAPGGHDRSSPTQ